MQSLWIDFDVSSSLEIRKLLISIIVLVDDYYYYFLIFVDRW